MCQSLCLGLDKYKTSGPGLRLLYVKETDRHANSYCACAGTRACTASGLCLLLWCHHLCKAFRNPLMPPSREQLDSGARSGLQVKVEESPCGVLGQSTVMGTVRRVWTVVGESCRMERAGADSARPEKSEDDQVVG